MVLTKNSLQYTTEATFVWFKNRYYAKGQEQAFD